MLKQLLPLICALSAVSGTRRHEENPKGAFDAIVKNKIDQLLDQQLRPLCELIDTYGEMILLDNEEIPKIGTFSVSLRLDGLSKFTHDYGNIKVSMVPGSGIGGSVEILFGWQNNQTMEMQVQHSVAMAPESGLEWFSGNGGIALTLKNFVLSLTVELQALKLDGVDILLNVSEDTRFTRFEHGDLDLKDTMNEMIHNRELLDIAEVLLSDLVNVLLKQETKAEEALALFRRHLQAIDDDVVTSLILLAQRMLAL